MANLAVNPTRMELTRLKGKLRTAQRGHKLLKDKRDELMKQFMNTVREVRALRAEVEEELMKVHGTFTVASALMSSEAMEQALLQLITTWRPNISELNDYSHRQFSEMMEHYYLPRWQMYFNARLAELRTVSGQNAEIKHEVTYNNGEAVKIQIILNPEMEKFELGFRSSGVPMLTTPKGDILSLAEKILQ